MSEPNASVPPLDEFPVEPGPLQFDEAEYATPVPAGPTCGVCKRAIADEYYEINGKVCCGGCRQAVEKALRGGSRVARFLKASILGSMAAAVGAVMYYVILRTTGYNIGLVAVVVGALVGGAVRPKGSDNRGGMFYQLLAVFLTYSAIVAMYVPFVFDGPDEAEEQQEPAKITAPKAEPQPKAPAIATKEASRPKGDEKPAPALAPKPTASDSAQVPEKKSSATNDKPGASVQAIPEISDPVDRLAEIIFWIGLVYKIPVYLAITDPITGLIFGFALWEAWKLNRRVEWTFNGPFRVSAKGLDAPTPEVADHGE